MRKSGWVFFANKFSSSRHMTTNPKELRENELRRMTIPQLKSVAKIPSKLKRKDDIIEFILSMEKGGDVGGISSEEEDHSKRIRMAPIFTAQRRSGETADCDLCSGNGTVWCELGIARCPMCRPAVVNQRVSTPPLVKYENCSSGPYSDIVVTDPSSGELSLQTDQIADKSMLLTMVSVYGYGICESIEALMGLGESEGVERAVERLIEKTRDSAENYSIAQAQLNSEEARENARTRSVTERKSGREKVAEDLSVLSELNAEFCRDFGDVIVWILQDPRTNSVLVYDYLVLRRDSIKWFKGAAEGYFGESEKRGLSDGRDDYAEFFTTQITEIQEAVFSLPASGGAIPELFRKGELPCVDDEDVQMVSVPSQPIDADLVIIEE